MQKVLFLPAAMIMLFIVSGCPAVNPAKTGTDAETADIAETGTTVTGAVMVNTVLIENHA